MSIKFQLASKDLPLVLVQVKVTGCSLTKKVIAIIDTGATGCVISTQLAESLEALPIDVPKDEKDVHGIGGKLRVEFVKLKEIRLDSLALKNMKTAVMDLSQIKAQFSLANVPEKRHADMILGFPFFKGRVLNIDYKLKKLSIYQEERK
ncbi:hypothetical protein Ctha_0835 [Chloroherpeton thalassium ATCC 35110]|uniref:Peptidase A2 domain-containing protein n=1 Tax=Chloroherpeton thalassium (strain ATCC 35110 / GB-78) TaxID=517418 RepID=B3QWT9_CHLT3|nr:retropepsin-like aspartic protease [Chloroherpeton thalassium]ACF13303.1 hypothetical protein Ctha_0835 [Chloroherpeton thalassium ATCC 35110]